MYFPFVRGKQFELIALRELAPRLPNNLYKPIIEPVRRNLLPLLKTIKKINEYNIEPIIIINPNIGDYAKENLNINDLLKIQGEDLKFLPCVKIHDESENYKTIIDTLPKRHAVFVAELVDKKNMEYLFGAEYAIIPKSTIDGILTRLKKNVVLIDDPFQKKSRNADYKDKSNFSDIHISFNQRPNVIGFSDYTIVGSDYSEAGGPAYVVTIHLSYIEDEYNQMFIRHFSSQESNSPANPGGKFKEAIHKCVTYIRANPTVFDDTLGLDELLYLYEKGHFPGLGQVKKISLEHHIETLCNFLDS